MVTWVKYAQHLIFSQHSKKLLRLAIFNDTLFLQKNDVMDYSLMVAVEEVCISHLQHHTLVNLSL
jgi:hypothetical protein